MPISFTLSVKPDLIGKDHLGYQTGTWQERTMTPDDLVQWAFIGHMGYVHSVFDSELFLNDPGENKTSRANRFFLYSEVVTLDIDSKDFHSDAHRDREDEYIAAAQLDQLLQIPFIQKHCFAIIPSSGNWLPHKPNWHLSFKLSERVTAPDVYRQIALALAAQINIPTDHQTCKAAQLTAGTLFKNPERAEMGYQTTDVYVNAEAEPVNADELAVIGPVSRALLEEIAHAREQFDGARQYQNKDHANKRITNHFRQTPQDREKVVLECLRYVLPTLTTSTPYEDWLQVWMAAHHGAPTEKVCEYIANHDAVYWSDGDAGRDKFRRTFYMHVDDPERGFSVASLFYLATLGGWLGETGYEIARNEAKEINVKHISDWLDTEEKIPRRLILHSQTGSGKTESLIHLYDRLGSPKTVVFVPTVKLATELAHKLLTAGLPATLYIDTTTGKRLSHDDLKEAHVLVTTLQTFGIKAFNNGTSMKEYGLVYVEESDQLIGQFARGGGSQQYSSSHVSEPQSKAGFAVIEDALKHAPYVWFVDATMTQVTHYTVTTLSPEPVQYIVNTYIRPKKTVNFVSEQGEAYRVVADSLAQDLRVVVACDKRERAHAVVEAMQGMNLLDDKKFLIITKDTEHEPAVKRFMEDVEAGAREYDLVAYNSVMASGVSIQKTTPDVVVQFCEYLTPRSNLQILNRYRAQGEVFCYYAEVENFYRMSADEIIGIANHRVDLESRVIFFPQVDRDLLSNLRSVVASISKADEDMQRRSPGDFYRRLLVLDGRKVHIMKEDMSDAGVEASMEEVRLRRRQISEEAMLVWRDTPIIDENHPAQPGATPLELEAGKLHGDIQQLLYGRIPMDIPQEEIAEICNHFRPSAFLLASLSDPARAIWRAEQFMADRSRSITSLANHGTTLAALMNVRILYPRLSDVLTQEQVNERSDAFLHEMELHHEHYDTIFERGQYKWEAMQEKYGDEKSTLAIMLARVLLSKVGLKLRKAQDPNGKRGMKVYPIERVHEAERFLNWRFDPDGTDPVSLDALWRGEAFDERRRTNAQQRFNELTTMEKEVFSLALQFNPASEVTDLLTGDE